MNRLTRSLSSEWRKVRSTKLWWILAIVLGAYSAMMAAMFAFIFGAMSDEMGGIALPAQATANMVYASVSTFGYVIPLLLGALMATGELRHRTLALTFTLEPQRGIVLLSKTIVLLGFGIAVGIAGLLGAIGAGAPVLAATDGDPMLGSGETWLLALRVLAALGLWSIIGFGIGVLVRNQAFAIVLALVFTQFVEPVLRTGAQFWEWSAQVAKFLPGSATDAFVGASVMTSMSSLDPSLPEGSGALGIWGGLLVMLAYAVIAVAAGWALRWRRDVV
ncbi:ABC transporter permease [Leucobacter celer]|uniref:ABC transporter permease n=1 Tax=Leucobacter celer TaxID=668625 RepID=UPI0006A7D201|nr:ABC transporter permease [Leucobacter celer]